MPIKSYILIPHQNRLSQLVNELSKIQECEVQAAENKEVAILVTDAPNEEEDKKIIAQIESCEDLAHMTMVSGFDEKMIQ